MATKSVIKTAKDVLDRFYRDAEGRTNRQIDVYFTLEDMSIPRDKAEAAIEYLVSRGLVNSFGTDIAFLTDAGVQAARDEVDISEIPKAVREFGASAAPSPQASEAAEVAPTGRVRPAKPFLMHITAEGEEYALPLDWICTVGRSEGNDVRVNDQRASKRHAEIFYRDGGYFLRDLNSANGTLLNGEYVVEDIALKHDDEVVIGRTMILFQTPEVVPRPAGPSPEELGNDEATVVPEPSASEPAAAATERPAEAVDPAPIKVVRGRPSPKPIEAPSTRNQHRPTADAMPTPVEDLFAEAPTKGAEAAPDLFAEPVRGGRRSASSESVPPQDLFAEPAAEDPVDLFATEAKTSNSEDLFATDAKKKRKDDDLFANDAPPAAPDADLFEPAPDQLSGQLHARSRAKTELQGASTPLPPRIDSDARLVAELTGSGGELEEIEPLPLDALSAPEEPQADDQAGEWEERTPTDAVLENVDVDDQPKDEATVMSSRADLYAAQTESLPPTDELPRWGEPALPSASVSADPGLNLDGEDLPDAALSLVNLRAVRPDPEEGAEGGLPPDAEAFQRTLAALRTHTERADLPDREAVLAAIDLLEGHPYIRVALKLLG